MSNTRRYTTYREAVTAAVEEYEHLRYGRAEYTLNDYRLSTVNNWEYYLAIHLRLPMYLRNKRHVER